MTVLLPNNAVKTPAKLMITPKQDRDANFKKGLRLFAIRSLIVCLLFTTVGLLQAYVECGLTDSQCAVNEARDTVLAWSMRGPVLCGVFFSLLLVIVLIIKSCTQEPKQPYELMTPLENLLDYLVMSVFLIPSVMISDIIAESTVCHVFQVNHVCLPPRCFWGSMRWYALFHYIFGFTWYLWLVIRSHFKSQKEQTDSPKSMSRDDVQQLA